MSADKVMDEQTIKDIVQRDAWLSQAQPPRRRAGDGATAASTSIGAPKTTTRDTSTRDRAFPAALREE
eukprot:CAMPEP_0197424102 /NCGR_PEP_ID=MMETSP1170-20131217/24670_1 /TAXON_ID=54406 /ORGANISM="Sarcinochrysis sp, Strain CCMP770" /LENGTH=67 /DNA_ID=CAMNT_0042951571 /DNA_START=41 /DNA_END=241 /DNA_ORIENTATION=-